MKTFGFIWQCKIKIDNRNKMSLNFYSLKIIIRIHRLCMTCLYTTYSVVRQWWSSLTVPRNTLCGFLAVFLAKKGKLVVFLALNWPYVGLKIEKESLVWQRISRKFLDVTSLTDHRVDAQSKIHIIINHFHEF